MSSPSANFVDECVKEDGSFAKELSKLCFAGKLGKSSFRCVAWMVFLSIFPDKYDLKSWEEILNVRREEYLALKKKYIEDPNVEADDQDLRSNNPLNAHSGSAWDQFFKDNELKQEIKQDVLRTYPELEFFREEPIQELMLNILFVYARENPDLSYRQGMHELLAPFVFVGKKALASPPKPSDLASLIHSSESSTLEADAFMMFSSLMTFMSSFFEHARPLFPVGGPNSGMAAQRAAIRSFGHALPVKDSSSSESDAHQPQSPLHSKCRDIHDLLMLKDPTLHKHLSSLSIPPHLYLMRWLRVLFAREFHLEDVLNLWDCILADRWEEVSSSSSSPDENEGDLSSPPPLMLVNHISVAMLMYIREQLLSRDENMVMRRLFKYPPVEDISILVDKALLLRETSSAADSVKMFTVPVPVGGSVSSSPASFSSPSSPSSPTRPLRSSNDRKSQISKIFNVDSQLSSKASAPVLSPISTTATTTHKPALPPRPTAHKERGGGGSGAAAQQSLLKEISRLKQNQNILADHLAVLITILQTELLSDGIEPNRSFDENNVFLAIAEMKIIKDVLNQSLPEAPETIEAIFHPSRQMIEIQEKYRQEMEKEDVIRKQKREGASSTPPAAVASADPMTQTATFARNSGSSKSKDVENPFLVLPVDKPTETKKKHVVPSSTSPAMPPFFDDVVLGDDMDDSRNHGRRMNDDDDDSDDSDDSDDEDVRIMEGHDAVGGEKLPDDDFFAKQNASIPISSSSSRPYQRGPVYARKKVIEAYAAPPVMQDTSSSATTSSPSSAESPPSSVRNPTALQQSSSFNPFDEETLDEVRRQSSKETLPIIKSPPDVVHDDDDDDDSRRLNEENTSPFPSQSTSSPSAPEQPEPTPKEQKTEFMVDIEHELFADLEKVEDEEEGNKTDAKNEEENDAELLALSRDASSRTSARKMETEESLLEFKAEAQRELEEAKRQEAEKQKLKEDEERKRKAHDDLLDVLTAGHSGSNGDSSSAGGNGEGDKIKPLSLLVNPFL